MEKIMKYLLNTLLLLLPFFGTHTLQAAPAQAMGYLPKYGPDFAHFDYVNPDAPKRGEIVLSSVGSFDSLNPFTLKGMAAEGLNPLLFETLMTPSLDEPFSQYGLLAEDSLLAEDGLSVTFRLNPEARFNDGSAVTAADVQFSFDTLKSEAAHPHYRIYWADIERAVVVDSRTVRFEFARVNPELHMIAGQIPVFSRAWVGEAAFSGLAERAPIASGPYLIASYDLGKNIVYRRNPDYWAAELNSRRGMFNFERVIYKYYRDFTVALEAFKAGEFDFNHEYNSKSWARDYNGAVFDSGAILREELPHQNNQGIQGFAFNLRRPLFQDQRVRQALALAFDFEWSNRQLFYDQYRRCYSYFSNSDLAATGLPQGDELALLEPWRKDLPLSLFTQEWHPPSTQPPATLRANLRHAAQLLREADWKLKGDTLINTAGEPFAFEVILAQKGFERILAPFARNLKKLGVEVSYRTVDRALYQQRLDSFDFDMVVTSFGQSQSPGNELRGMFHSSAAVQEGSQNIIGIRSPVVDAMIDKVIYAPNRQSLVTAVRALDRVLLAGDYLIPHWYIGTHRVAYRDRFGIPQQRPLYYTPVGWLLQSWWAKGE
ncbi:MAG: ABC transporter substrate-binding protein [Gammaproteobacteria bacterium]|nr:ABC transporter substrate-binding protein [Gammaproteobacteria bacterium]